MTGRLWNQTVVHKSTGDSALEKAETVGTYSKLVELKAHNPGKLIIVVHLRGNTSFLCT